MTFDKLKLELKKCGRDPGLIHTKDGAVGLFCSDCDFYKESDKDLECGAFKLLRRLVEKKIVTVENISDALGE